MSSYSFTYNQEIGHQGQSLVPHYPGGASGVTIGPGYDMGHRSPQEIYNQLTEAGIDPETAYALIHAAHKTGEEAGRWVAQQGGISITEKQQQALFENVLVPEYEQRTKDQLETFAAAAGLPDPVADWDQLSDKQRAILFDYVYNTGSLQRFPEMTLAVLQQDWDEVALHYERFSGDQPLAYRNEMFYREFLDPDYAHEWETPEAEPGTAEDLQTEAISLLYEEPEETPDAETSDDWYDNE